MQIAKPFTPGEARPRIFVQIASYRDPECLPTLTDLFAKAAFPERLRVGLCQQLDPAVDTDCLIARFPRPGQVRVVEHHADEARGAVWARVEARKLWQGEEYTLQIHAHHRFERNWDETLVRTLESLPQTTVLTGWMPPYLPPAELRVRPGFVPVAAVGHVGGWPWNAQLVDLRCRWIPESRLPPAPLPAYFVLANLMFARSEVFEAVPFDPSIYFYGEEINYSVRLWTHGYDVRHLRQPVLHHLWQREGRKGSDLYANHQYRLNQVALRRNLHLLGLETTRDEAALKDLDGFGLGTARSLAEFWELSGVDLTSGSISREACEGLWPELVTSTGPSTGI